MSDQLRLKRLAKYIDAYPVADTMYYWGMQIDRIIGYSDSDWAGDPRTRKSTSGGCLIMNGSVVKSWSRTQRTIALSSGEAELYAAIKVAQEILGIQSLAKDLGMRISGTLAIDAKATMGMISRRGLGQLRHIEVHNLWLQQIVNDKRIAIVKVWSHQNLADILTKYVTPDLLAKHLGAMSMQRYRNWAQTKQH